MILNYKRFERSYTKRLEKNPALSAGGFSMLLQIQRRMWQDVDYTKQWLQENNKKDSRTGLPAEITIGPHYQEETLCSEFCLKFIKNNDFFFIDKFHIEHTRDGVANFIYLKLRSLDGRTYAYKKKVQRRKKGTAEYPLTEIAISDYGRTFVLIRKND